MKKQNIQDLLIFIIAAELVGTLSGIASGGNFGSFYRTLRQPPFSPPGWLFPVAWVILYALMGISAYLVQHSDHEQRRNALKLYRVQLAVNFLWSPVFFRLHSLEGAVAVILLLLILVIAMTIWFWRIRRPAGWLNLPYLLWTAYAAYLTIGVARLN